ncbi:hypothetical protein CDL15_Pgr023374 [Punica granatum]|uniref:Protein kinase domain-containing protein n=1 Tax=Punica granatum TaxID=22663 RepID=A0A218Y2H8_PUNGR|nr:hypothetical protein CDL15_Pgr023374 [Punica granatum]
MAGENFQHQNIMRLLAYDEDDKNYYLIYDHMPSSLEEKLTDLSWEDTVEILKGIAKGLDHMQQKGYVHGDFKPANVLLADVRKLSKKRIEGNLMHVRDELETIEVSRWNLQGYKDFWIGAKKWVNIFTPGYGAPEGNGGPLSDRVDVFSFGIVMLQLLSRNLELEVLMVKGKKPKKMELRDWTIMELGLKHHAVHKNFKESCNKDIAIALTELAVRCTNSNRNGRPLMSEVVQKLNNLVSQAIIPDQVIN